MLTLAPLLGSRMLHKNIQDPLRSIQTPSRGQFFQVAALGRREFVIENNRRHVLSLAPLRYVFCRASMSNIRGSRNTLRLTGIAPASRDPLSDKVRHFVLRSFGQTDLQKSLLASEPRQLTFRIAPGPLLNGSNARFHRHLPAQMGRDFGIPNCLRRRGSNLARRSYFFNYAVLEHSPNPLVDTRI